jgi:type IV pilus assembly protein PilA
MKMMHRGEKGFTLIELLIVVAILGIIAAVIIPNVGRFMSIGTLSAANSEAENVKTAALAYYADVQDWPNDTSSEKVVDDKTYRFIDYFAGKLKAKYYFDGNGFITGVSSPDEDTPTMTSSEYDGIVWQYPIEGVAAEGHGQWVRE